MTSNNTIGVGVIGLGVRGTGAIGLNMIRTCKETGFRITALCDRNVDRMGEVREALVRLYAEQGVTADPQCYADGRNLIAAPEVDLVMITSITDTHRQFAVPALRSGKKVYCDKPLAQNVEDAEAIVAAEAETGNRLIMGFTRRYEAPWQKAYELLQQGAIGELRMMQVRDVIPYYRYLTAWWRRREWSGGALNDKGSHLFDVFNWFSGSRARKIHGFGGQSMIAPDPTAPPRCSVCDRDCPYRRREKGGAPAAPGTRAHFGPSWQAETEEKYMDDVCVYAPGTDLYHNASIHLTYENDVIASYFYTIFGPDTKDQETFELIGTNGRILLNRHAGTLDVATDYGDHHEVIDCRTERFMSSHFGADIALIEELRRFYDGAPPTVSARDGLDATRLVMAALASMDAGGKVIDL